MSWPERPWHSARPFLAWRQLVVGGLIAFGLAGCGFRPLHGTSAGASTYAVERVAVVPMPEWYGQALHLALSRRLSAGLASAQPTHILSITLVWSSRDLFTQKDTSVSRVEMLAQARYTLKPAGTNALAVSGVERSSAPFERPSTTEGILSEAVGRRDAQERALADLAERIARRVELALSRSEPAALPATRP